MFILEMLEAEQTLRERVWSEHNVIARVSHKITTGSTTGGTTRSTTDNTA